MSYYLNHCPRCEGPKTDQTRRYCAPCILRRQLRDLTKTPLQLIKHFMDQKEKGELDIERFYQLCARTMNALKQ